MGFQEEQLIGMDYNRLTLLVAVLEKKVGLNLGNQDVYINVVGGIKLNEPAIDLGVVLATASSYKNIPIPRRNCRNRRGWFNRRN